MTGEQKITMEHRHRRAVVYVRQSSEQQVKQNLESQRLQYHLADRARALGFAEVEVIDTDLGASAGLGARRREGFERLLGAVALRQVGLVLCRELSRLSRTDKDFCQLVELCQLFGTLVGDDVAVYDTRSIDDQLVLGIKATMSAVELSVLRLRLAQGKENKARRGELYPRLPAGYVWDEFMVLKHPNARVREAIELLFTTFRETWSIRQTFKWLHDQEIELPVTTPGGADDVVFKLPTLSFVSGVLHNPFYAGVYAWGRRPTEVVWREGELRKRQAALLPPEEARVFLRDHHEGYIDWATFEEHQRMITRNSFRGESDETAGAVRAGHGLLAGLLRCGVCGRRLYVRYWGKAGTSARYLCTGNFGAGGEYCLGFGGATVDRRFGEELMHRLSPLGVHASLQALDRLGSEHQQEWGALQRRIEQLEYEATRAFEQYDEVDARNRLVAAELERRWNHKLEQVERARARLTERELEHPPVSSDERIALLALGERFAHVWGHAACPIELKKQLVRTLVEEIVVSEDPPGHLSFVVHWKGGSHTAFDMAKPNAKTVQRTDEADLDVIRKMAPRYGDDAIASVLNKLGRRTGKGKRWSRSAVKSARNRREIPGRTRTVDDPEVLTLQAAASYTATSDTTIKKLVDGGVLAMQQLVPFAPWEIRRADLDAEPVRAVLEHLRRTGRVVLTPPPSQGDLFERDATS